MRRREKQAPESNHHRVPNSRGGGNGYPNIKRIRVTIHRAIHTFFANQTTPEKIWTIIEMDKEILTEEFKRQILNVISQEPKKVFIKGAFKNFPAFKRLKTILKTL